MNTYQQYKSAMMQSIEYGNSLHTAHVLACTFAVDISKERATRFYHMLVTELEPGAGET